MSVRLSLSQISSDGAFFALRREWNELLAVSRSDTICLTWEWLWTWWQIFGKGRELRLIIARDPCGRLDAIAPLAVRTVRHGIVLQIRRLEFLGSGEPVRDSIWSEYLDLIVRSGCETEAVSAVSAWLAQSTDWDEVHFANTLGNSLASELGDRLGDRSFPITKLDKTPSLCLALPGDADAVAHLLRPASRRKLRQYLRREAAVGGFEIKTCQGRTDLQGWLDQLIALHQKRWTDRGESGVFSSSRFLEFHRRIAPLLFELGKLALYAVRQNGRTVAVIYCFRHGRKIFAYQSGFDIRRNSGVSLGLVTYALCLEEAVRSGAEVWDFLRGEEPYKKLWPVVKRPYTDIHVWARRGRPMLARQAFLAWLRVRALLKRAITLCSLRRAGR